MDEDWTTSWVDQNGAWRLGEPPAGWLQGDDGRWWPPTRSPTDGFVTSPRSGPRTPAWSGADTTPRSPWARASFPPPTPAPSPPITVEVPVVPLPPLPAAVPPGAGAVAGVTGPRGWRTWATLGGVASVVVLVVALLAVTIGGAGRDAETLTLADTESEGSGATSAPTTAVPPTTTTAPTTTIPPTTAPAPPPPPTTATPAPPPVVTAPPATTPPLGSWPAPSPSPGPGGLFGPFADCAAAQAAGAAPVHADDPGYTSHLDRDGDGVACES